MKTSKARPRPGHFACKIGPICRHHSLRRMHLRKQRFSELLLKLCLSHHLSLHLLNNNYVCFLKENLQQQWRLQLAVEASNTCTLSVNDLNKNYCIQNYITNMGLIFFKAVAFVPGLSGDHPLLLRHSDASFIITMLWPICQEKNSSH